MPSVYIVAYLAFSVPAVVAGIVSTHLGLPATAIGCAFGVAARALAAIIGTGRITPGP